MKSIRIRFGATPMLALALFHSVSVAQTTAGGGASSSNPNDLCGKWKVETPGGYSTDSSRFFEFFPDGRLLETTTYNGPQGESTHTYKKSWSVVGNKVLIVRSGQSSDNGQSITVEIPFDLSRLQIVETWESPNSTRSTKMFAVREGGSREPPAAVRSQLATPAPPARPSDLLSKLDLAVSPSTRDSHENYYKIQRIALSISLRNPSLRDATGPLTVSYWIFGKSNGKSVRQFCVFAKGRFDCSLGTNSSSREFKTTTEQYQNKHYDTTSVISSETYYDYSGWIVAVSDPSGKIAIIKSNNPAWEREEAKLPALESGSVYDLQLGKVQGARYYNYSY
jgi:hypothetical protein